MRSVNYELLGEWTNTQLASYLWGCHLFGLLATLEVKEQGNPDAEPMELMFSIGERPRKSGDTTIVHGWTATGAPVFLSIESKEPPTIVVTYSEEEKE